jgi:hypothetical protein
VWAFTLALLTCLGIDFSNPLLPGVVRFGEEESVHALRAERSRTDVRPARAVPTPTESATPGIDGATTGLHATPRSLDSPRPVLTAWRPRASTDRVRSGPSAPEDH